MTKYKRIGWAIAFKPGNPGWRFFVTFAETRCEAIRKFERLTSEGFYAEARRKGDVKAVKLYVEAP